MPFVSWVFFFLSYGFMCAFARMAAQRTGGKGIDFGAHGATGIAPHGVAWLLAQTGLNSENLWQRSSEYWAHGVLCPRSAITDKTVAARIEQLAQHYPVNGAVKHMAVAVHERKLRNEHYLFRGDYLIGDSRDIAAFWADCYIRCRLVNWEIGLEAMCWTPQIDEAVFIPYIDLDERAPTGTFGDVWETRVVPCVKVINAALMGLGVEVERMPIFMNIRDVEGAPGLSKYSFHVHWPGLGIRSIGTWRSFLLSLCDLPRAIEWVSEEGKWHSSPRTGNLPCVDLAVYGGKSQLFRGPYCGKRGDARAIMYPVVVSRDGANGYKYTYVNTESGADRSKIISHILDARISACATEVKILDIPESITRPAMVVAPRVASVSGRVCLAPSVAPMDPTIDNIHRFITPFLERFILPEWQLFRHRMLMSSGGVEGAVVPTTNLKIRHEKKAEKQGRAFFSVTGDTFCECDDAHVHTTSPGRIGLVVDYVSATIAQTCFVCGPSKRFPVYSFLHTKNQIRIVPRDRCGHSRISCWGKSVAPHQTLLDFYGERFCVQGETQLVHVYDDEKRVWCTGRTGNAIAGKLIDSLNRVHAEYLDAQRRVFMDLAIARLDAAEGGENSDAEDVDDIDVDEDDEDGGRRKAAQPKTREEFIRDLERKARLFISKRTDFITFTSASRTKILAELAGCTVHTQVLQMNPFANLIPMRSGHYIDVFTGAIGDMERHHFFTSVVNAQFNPEDPNIPTILDWILEISTGEKEKAQYLKRIGAYCLTMLVHDRKFYFIVGNGGNGKGMFKEFIVIISKGPDGYEKRVKILNTNFWSSRANASSSAESPTPEAWAMRNATLLYTDEMGAVSLDSQKLKRVVGGEEQAARGLYGDSCDVKPRGKVAMTSNFDPNGPGDDQAFWDRAVVVRMKTKYVEDAASVDPMKYRFRRDFAKAAHLLTMTDAFFTVCVAELIAYYKSVTASDGLPLLMSLPVPDEVRKSTLAAKEKRMPLAAFVRKHLEDTMHPLQYVKVQDAFSNYMRFLENCNETAVAKRTTVTNFEELLAMALGIQTIDISGCAFIEGKRLTSQVIEQPQQRHQYAYTGVVPNDDSHNQDHPRF